MKNERLTGNQKKIDVAEPKGKITAADFEKLRSTKESRINTVKTKQVQVMTLFKGDTLADERGNTVGNVSRVQKDQNGKYHVFVSDRWGRESEYGSGFSPFSNVSIIKSYSSTLPGPRNPRITESGDHEVAMAMSSLKEIVEAAQELMSKLGGQERNIPGWIQDHITNAENFIVQASQGFHELHGDDEDTSLVGMVQEIKNKNG